MRSNRLQREIDTLVAQGWAIEDEAPDRVVMVDREFGSVASHIVVAMLTIWWTMGLGNVLWGAYNYAANSRRRVLWERQLDCPNCGATVSEDVAYCPSCGRDVEAEPVVDTDVCPECDAVVGDDARYCRACGAKLADATESAG
ncbi:zinc ribbon domain-containing protein [Halosolutus gelatinilyticus]|uniref:zinc ribbon domain-containing protein n=1 Tax=Halosolutus gelatinilyticus TaxID=2931975 RepID=UPI001FF48A0A|nr:zinc ribbon domain-containing protein [Halosolutus gelatinilyticus]